MAEREKERAERVEDAQVATAYRALGTEEPPQALDEAILAASRRAARPQRWAVPLSLAAVVVLSVVVTLRIRHERPEVLTAQAPAVAREPARVEAPAPPQPLRLKQEEQLKSAPKAAQPEPRRNEPKPFADAKNDRTPAMAAAAPPPAASGALSSRGETGRAADTGLADSPLRRTEERTARDAEAAARAPQAGALFAKRPASSAAAAPAADVNAKSTAEPPAKAAEQAASAPADTPEREFERIARLRAEGRHDEADRAFLEFRRRYPDFRITEEMLRRVERR